MAWVQHRKIGPWLDPALPADAVDLAATALGETDPAAQWKVVAAVETPWGPQIRLRPFVGSLELRGADCLLFPPVTAPRKAPAGSGEPAWRFERDPRSIDWAGLAALAGRLEARKNLPALGSLPLRAGSGRYFLSPSPGSGGSWDLRMEIACEAPGAEDAATPGASPPAWAQALPWDEMPAAWPALLDLDLWLDPETLEIRRVRDGRILSRDPAISTPGNAGLQVDGADAAGSALIFDPNPIVTSGRADLRDGDPVDPYRVWRNLARLDGDGYLRGRWVETQTDRPPRAVAPIGVYAYLSADPRFEEAMAYYHGDHAIARADSLGFHGLFDQRLRLRVHATDLDNSWYSRPSHEVVFGDGGVDDAEDADIILHEVGHAIHDALVPGFGGGDTRAISEGFADFWAASLTGDPCVAEWDATAYGPPCLRRTDNDAVYPESLTGSPHADGEIWSGALWDLRGLLGRESAETLALAGFLEQGTESNFPEAALGLLRAAGRIGLQDQLRAIERILAHRGLVPESLELVLAPGEARAISLLRPARFLGQEVTGVTFEGSGRILFTRPPAPSPLAAFPGGGACAVPCGLETTALDGWDDLELRVSVVLGNTRTEIRQVWTESGRTLARIEGTWEMDRGAIEWMYDDARSGPAGFPFFAGATRAALAPDSLASLDWERFPSGGLEEIQGFRGDLGSALPNLIGIRLRLEAVEPGAAFRLLRTAAPVAPAGGPIQITAQPNPFAAQTRLRLYLHDAGPARVRIFGPAGRVVRDLAPGRDLERGLTELVWDGRDGSGRVAPAGRYWARVDGLRSSASVSLVRLR